MCAFAFTSTPTASTAPELAAPRVARPAPAGASRIGRPTGSLRHPVTGRPSSDPLRRPRAAR